MKKKQIEKAMCSKARRMSYETTKVWSLLVEIEKEVDIMISSRLTLDMSQVKCRGKKEMTR